MVAALACWSPGKESSCGESPPSFAFLASHPELAQPKLCLSQPKAKTPSKLQTLPSLTSPTPQHPKPSG